MPCKLRIEYEGAIYPVISRRNYRSAVFARETTKRRDIDSCYAHHRLCTT